ncbi:MAG: adenylate kinase [Candidatus Omnitrophota bacterium]
MKIILFGSPGSGKGTQAVMLSKYFNLKKISLGDILREEVKKNSELGQEVKNYMEKGLLVPDEVVLRVVEENINFERFILDGYPRNLSQAKKLDEILEKNNNSFDSFIYLDVGQQTIIGRLSKRRICKSCGANYHLENLRSREEGICDNCGAELVQRADDDPEVIKKRWEVFSDQSRKILDFYQNKGKLIKVDGNGDKEEIFERIKYKLQ